MDAKKIQKKIQKVLFGSPIQFTGQEMFYLGNLKKPTPQHQFRKSCDKLFIPDAGLTVTLYFLYNTQQ